MEEYQVSDLSHINFVAKKLFELIKKAKKGLTVRISINRKLKSKEQRGYYRAVVIPIIAKACGYESYDKEGLEFVHEGLKELFCPLKKNKAGFMVKSTELLDSKETEDYYVMCRRYGSTEYGVFIPLPNEDDYF